MNLIKFNPFAPARHHHDLSSFVDDFFNTSIADFVGSDFVSSLPSVNIIERADNFKVELAAPGLEKSDFDINIEKNQLTISAKQEKKEEETEDKFTRREFNYTSFSRSFRLTEKVDSKNISAKYENGVLEVTVPKKEEAKEQPAINIEIK